MGYTPLFPKQTFNALSKPNTRRCNDDICEIALNARKNPAMHNAASDVHAFHIICVVPTACTHWSITRSSSTANEQTPDE